MTIEKKMKLEITHSLPPEIIREILLKATVKSLLRCKSVCKEWYSLISDQNFIKTHYTLSCTNNVNYQHYKLIYTTDEPSNNLYICPLYDVLVDKPAINVLRLKNPLQRPRGLSIVGSCNGLVCLSVKNDDYDFFIYNPSTRISNGLPFRRRNSRRRNSRPYTPSFRYSFGYGESNDDYKIVEMSTTKEVNIYSLKTGKWKNIGDFSYQYPYHPCGIFSNGALHWVALDNSSSSYTQRIVSLDLSKETYGEVLQPEGGMNLSLGVLGECLCGLCYYYESHADLWIMKVYGVKDSWTKLASFPYSTHRWIRKNPVPFFISNDGNVLIDYAMSLVIYKSYKSKDSSFVYFDRCCKACIVVESLVSPFPPLALADNNEN